MFVEIIGKAVLRIVSEFIGNVCHRKIGVG